MKTALGRRSRMPVAILAAMVLGLVGCMSGVPTSSPSVSVSPPVASDQTTPTAPGTATPLATGTPPATPSATAAAQPLRGLRLQVLARGLQHPVDVKARPGDGALFVAEQPGVIRRVRSGAVSGAPLLDIRDVVNDVSIEQGLLGFAFHPRYPSDPRVFIYHSKANNDNVLVAYETRGNPDAAMVCFHRNRLDYIYALYGY